MSSAEVMAGSAATITLGRPVLPPEPMAFHVGETAAMSSAPSG
jgi:hypothetical protein